MNADFLIRQAEAADLPRLNELTSASAAYKGEFRAMLEGYVIGPEQLARDLFVLAELDGRVMGYYSLILGPDPELDLMFVADEAQGLGLGETLFRHMTLSARGHGLKAVRIVSHPPAAGFYERMGAQRVGTQPPRGRVSWERPIYELAIV